MLNNLILLTFIVIISTSTLPIMADDDLRGPLPNTFDRSTPNSTYRPIIIEGPPSTSHNTTTITKKIKVGSSRIALVIGNGTYLHTTRLINAVNDARDMYINLHRLGFDVTQLENLEFMAMKKAIENFTNTLATNPGVGLFYFAGHGVRSNSGLNYLIPIDYQPTDRDDLENSAVDADAIRINMEKANTNALNLIILDACRDDPFRSLTRSINGNETNRGLKLKKSTANGTLIALSTCPGCVASDGQSGNGLYTSYLLKYIIKPGLNIEEIFKSVTKDVTDKTNNEQKPWYHASMRGEFVLFPANGLRPPPITNWIDNAKPTTHASVDIVMYHDRGWKKRPLKLRNGSSLKSGDKYFFYIKLKQDSYLYMYQIDNFKKAFRLFPSEQYGTENNPVRANRRLELPNVGKSFALDNTIGEEKFFVLVSEQPVNALENFAEGSRDVLITDAMMSNEDGVRGPLNTVQVRESVDLPRGTDYEDEPQETDNDDGVERFDFEKNMLHVLSIRHRPN